MIEMATNHTPWSLTPSINASTNDIIQTMYIIRGSSTLVPELSPSTLDTNPGLCHVIREHILVRSPRDRLSVSELLSLLTDVM
jgi:hypothetical protein